MLGRYETEEYLNALEADLTTAREERDGAYRAAEEYARRDIRTCAELRTAQKRIAELDEMYKASLEDIGETLARAQAAEALAERYRTALETIAGWHDDWTTPAEDIATAALEDAKKPAG